MWTAGTPDQLKATVAGFYLVGAFVQFAPTVAVTSSEGVPWLNAGGKAGGGGA